MTPSGRLDSAPPSFHSDDIANDIARSGGGTRATRNPTSLRALRRLGLRATTTTTRRLHAQLRDTFEVKVVLIIDETLSRAPRLRTIGSFASSVPRPIVLPIII